MNNLKVTSHAGMSARVGALTPRDAGWNYIAECEVATQRGCKEAAPDSRSITGGLERRLAGIYRDLCLSVQWSASLVSGLDLGIRIR